MLCHNFKLVCTPDSCLGGKSQFPRVFWFFVFVSRASDSSVCRQSPGCFLLPWESRPVFPPGINILSAQSRSCAVWFGGVPLWHERQRPCRMWRAALWHGHSEQLSDDLISWQLMGSGSRTARRARASAAASSCELVSLSGHMTVSTARLLDFISLLTDHVFSPA